PSVHGVPDHVPIPSMTDIRCNCFGSETPVLYGRAGEYYRPKRNIPWLRSPCMWRYRAVIICLVGTLAGCVQYHASPLKLRAGADEFAARRLADVQLRDELVRLLPQAESSWPPREWDRAELL